MNAVIFLRVIDPRQAVVEVSDYLHQTSRFAQTTLRSVLGEVELDELLARRDKINMRLQSILDTHTAQWGVKVANVEVKQVDLPVEHQFREAHASIWIDRRLVYDELYRALRRPVLSCSIGPLAPVRCGLPT